MSHATIEEFVAHQSDALILKVARFVWQMHIISAVLVAAVLWQLFSSLHLLSWAGWMVSLALVQAYIAFKGTNLARRGSPIQHWGKAFDGTALLLALGWGWLGFGLQPNAEHLQAFIGFLIAGGVVTGTGTHNVHYRTLVMTLLLIVPAQAARVILNQPDQSGLVAAGMLMLFMGLMLGLGWVLRGFTLSGFSLQWEKSRLADQLAAQADELREARIAADEANFSKSHFLAQASHDLRQPLHGIGLLVAALPDTGIDTSSKSILTRVRRSLDGLARLFDSLLDVTLLDTGQTKLAVKPHALGPLLESINDVFASAAAERDVDLTVVSTRSNVLADATILRRIIHNLVGNALQHSYGDRIVVGVRHRAEGVFLEVWDNGRGMPADQHHRIFEDFARIENPLDVDVDDTGLGLGLAIVARLAAHHGIDIRVHSVVGRGTGFVVGPLSPTRIDQHQEEAPAPRTLWQTPERGFHVWVVSDDRDACTGLTALLEQWNYTHESMPSWERSSPSMQRGPDLLITDMHLFGSQSGFDVAAGIRETHGDDVAVIVITADTDSATHRQVTAAGYGILYKPVRPGQLRAAILATHGSKSVGSASAKAT